MDIRMASGKITTAIPDDVDFLPIAATARYEDHRGLKT